LRVQYHIWGEGPDDVGRPDPRGKRAKEGCIDAFVDQAAGGEIALECTRAGYLKHLKKLPGPRRKWQRGLKGFALHGYIATREALLDGADWVIVSTDTDRESGARRQRDIERICHRKRQELATGHRKAIEDALDDASTRLVREVPLRKLEAWLLADARAFKAAVGKPRPKLPKKPEELGGQSDPKLILDASGGSSRKLEIARACRPSALSSQCPVSYPPFLDDILAGMNLE
jgi:hypothetical protein